MKKIIATLVALCTMAVMTISVLAVSILPAQAACPDGYCSDVYHYAPDNGYDAPFLAECKAWTSSGGAYTYNFYIYEGASGRDYGCPDVQRVYVYSGKQIACSDLGGGWPVAFDATGWHNVGGWAAGGGGSVVCVHQLD